MEDLGAANVQSGGPDGDGGREGGRCRREKRREEEGLGGAEESGLVNNGFALA